MIPDKLYMTINISCFVFLRCFFPAVVVVSVAANKQQGATGSEQHAGNSHNTHRYNSRRMDDHRNAQELQQDEEREQHAQSKHRNTKKRPWQRQQRWQQEEQQLGRLPKKKRPGHPLVPSGPTATFQWCDQAQLVLPCCGGTDSPPKQLALVQLTMIAKKLHWLHKSTGEVHRYSSKFNRSAGPQTCLGKYVQKLR